MAKLLMKSVALLVAAAAGLSGAQAAPLTASSEKVVMLVNQTVTPDGTVRTSARSGPLTTSGSVFSIDRFGNASTAVPVSLPPISTAGSFATPTRLPTQGTIANIANAHLRANFPQLKSGLGSYLRQKGITSGWFNFKQQVRLDVNGSAETWTIYWDFFTDANGRGAYGEAKIVPAEPKTLYAVYTPLRVSSDLPSNWAFDGAGTLKYQLRDVQFQPLTDWVTVNVGGAYDTLESGLETLDSGLSCLMDTANPGCTASTTDIKSLMDRTGAVLSVVDYVRRVEPEYEDKPDGSRVPKMTASLTQRELNYSGCTAPVFRNIGNLEYTLKTTVARYLAGSVGVPRTVQYEQIQEFSGTYLSPGYPYELSLQVPRRDTRDLATKAIDPLLKNQLMNLADIPGLQYPVSAIKINGDPNQTIGSTSGVTWQYGGRDDAYQMTWTLKCAQYDEGYELATNISSTHHWNGWHPNTEAKSPVSSTGWSPVALNDFGSSRYSAYSDFARGIVFLQDGSTSGSYSYRSSGQYEGTTSGFICAHNRFSLLAQIGTVYECNAPTTDYSCAARGHDYDHYLNGNFMGHVASATCTGYMWVRGLYMSNGSPYYEYQELSRIDRSTEAQYNCRDGKCAWEVRDGVEPVEPEPEPDPVPSTPPPTIPTTPPPTTTPPPGNPTCVETSWPNRDECPAGYTGEITATTYISCPNGPYGEPYGYQADHKNTCVKVADPPQLPPPPPATCPYAGQTAAKECWFVGYGGGSDCIEGDWFWAHAVYVASDPTCSTTQVIESGNAGGYLDGCPGRHGGSCPAGY